MDRLSAKPIIQDQKAIDAARTSNLSLILAAWLGTLLLSRLPQIILSELGVITPSDWSLWWWIMLGTALFALTYLWAAVRPLRGYFLILTMIYVVTIGLSLLQETSFWDSWFGSHNPWLISFFGERLGVVFMALALGGILTLLGYKRQDFFVALGNVNAKAEGMHLHWSIAGPVIGILLAALTVAAVLSMVSLSSVMFAVAMPLLPAVCLFALMNAFGEELAYRAAPLSQLWEIVGKQHATWMTALWFGLGHYYGGISFGAIGVIYITLTAVIFGKAMLETKGLAVPVFMHMLIDVVIYIVLALGSL